MAGAGETLGSLALAAAGSEAELFYAVGTDGGYRFELQHLSPGGAAVGASVQVAVTRAAFSTPLVSVASDGSSVICCWEDYGPPAFTGSPSCVSGQATSSLIRCTSVPVGGSSVDSLADGGFTDCGLHPVVVIGGGVPEVVYLVPAMDEIGLARPFTIGWPWAIYAGFAANAVAAVSIDAGFELLLNDTLGIGYMYVYSCDFDGLCSDYIRQGVSDSDAGSFAAAASDSILGLAIERTDVTASVTDTDAGTTTDAVTLNATGEQPTGPVGAATCASGFGYAYAIDGGAVMFLETGFDGTLFDGGGSTAVANLATNARALALIASDGGLLLATGTPSQIDVSFVTCH